MDETEVQSIVHGLISDAISYVDTELSPRRAMATDYYGAKPFGNEEEGRSQVVVPEVRDTILAVLPDLMKLFFGAERAVEFVPRNAAGVEQARQATEYIHKIFAEDCGGFLLVHGALKDGLLKSIGSLKHGIVDGEPEVYELENVTESQLQALAARDDLELTKIKESGVASVAPADPAVAGSIGVTQQTEKTYSVSVTKAAERKLAVWGVPPEECIFLRDARDQKSTIFWGHRTEKTQGELVAMGIDEDLIEEHGGQDSELEGNAERVARNPGENPGLRPDAGEANTKILYIESYVRVDADGDGRAELRKVCTIGPGHHIVNGDGLGEPVDSCPMPFWTPDPEPHTVIGQSLFDLTKETQRTTSALLRGVLDSAAASLFPRTAYQEGMVSVQDILNTEIGAPIRTKGIPSNNVQTFAHQFTGAQLMPVIEHFGQMKENSTGLNPGAMGIDADALQSSTKQAVGAAVTASQARTELLARVFAEMLLKPLFRGMLKDLVALQPRKSMERLRGQWIEVDPASWDANMDVTVNVALGTTAVDGKIETLTGVLAEQKDILTTLGPGNPIVTLGQYRATLADILALKGYKDASRYFNEIPADWQPPAPDPSQQKPSPDEQLVQLEQMKAQHAAQMAEQKAQQDAQRQQADLQFKQAQLDQERMLAEMKLAQDRDLRVAEMQAQYGFEANQAQIEADVELAKHRAQLEVDQARTSAQMEAENQRHLHQMALEHEREVASMQLEHEREQTKMAHAAQAAARDHELKKATAQSAAAEKAKPAPAPAAPAPPNIEIHNHIPSGKKKFTRGKDGKVDGVEDAE